MMTRVYDAILLLGLQLNEDDSPRPELLLRVQTAADAWLAGRAPVIVCCGGPTGKCGATEAQVMALLLTAQGVPETAVILEDRSMVTTENIENARAILGHKARRVLLVTSDYHVARARLICRRSGFRAHGCPAIIPDSPDKRHARRMELLYTADFLMGWTS